MFILSNLFMLGTAIRIAFYLDLYVPRREKCSSDSPTVCSGRSMAAVFDLEALFFPVKNVWTEDSAVHELQADS